MGAAETWRRVCVNTDHVEPNHRVAYWEAMAISTSVGLIVHPFAETFNASQIWVDLGEFRLMQIEGQKHMVERSPALVQKYRKPSLFLTLLLEGPAFVSQAEECVTLAPGDMVLYNTDSQYVLGCPAPTRHVTFDLPVTTAERIPGMCPQNGPARVDGSLGLGRFLSRELRTRALQFLSSSGESRGTPWTQIQPLLELTFSLAQQRGTLPVSSSATLLRAQAFIIDHLGDPLLDVDLVGDAVHVSTRQLHRLFAASGTSVRRWIMTRRLDECARALRDPSLGAVSIAEVCYRWGFSDAAHFSRTFKQAFGHSPVHYRNLHRTA